MRIRSGVVSPSDWIMNWMIIRARLVKVTHTSQLFIGQSARFLINQSDPPTRLRLFCLRSSLRISPTRFPLRHVRSVSGTAALIFLHGRRRILKATITAQNYQFPLLLTLWEERGRGRAQEGMRDSNLGWREATSARSHRPPRVQSCVRAGGGWHLLAMNLTLPLEVIQVTIQQGPPLSSLPANRPGRR